LYFAWTAFVLAFADAFVIVAVVLGISALLVLMLPPLHPKSARTSTPTAGASALVNSANASGSGR
jgi:hypothetical protein